MSVEDAIRAELAAIEAGPVMARHRALTAALASLSPLSAAMADNSTVDALKSAARSGDGIRTTWKTALDCLPPWGGETSDWRARYNRIRPQPLAEGSWQAQLSNMKTAGLIEKRDGRWFAKPQTNNGPDSPTEGTSDPLSVQPEQEG